MMLALKHAENRTDTAPSSYEEAFRHYSKYVIRLVQEFGIEAQQAEDVAQILWMKFFEKDVLGDYDPEYTWVYKGRTCRASFRTFLNGFVRTYVYHYVLRQQLGHEREPFSTDMTFGQGDEEVAWYDLAVNAVEDDHDALLAYDLVRSISVRLAAIPPRSGNDRCRLDQVFQAVADQVESLGKIDAMGLARHFKVSKNTAHTWLARLREGLVGILTSC